MSSFKDGKSPQRDPETRSEKIVLWVFGLLFVGLMLVEVMRDYQPAKLSIPFFLISWPILLVLHEMGHALTARCLGWEVKLVSIGFGAVRWRTRWLGMPVEVRTFPISGFALPQPRDLIAPRLKTFLTYAGGPGVEIFLVLGLAIIFTPATLLTATDSVPIIATQSFCVAALMGIFFTLLPFPAEMEDGSQSWSDGLGMILCWRLPDEYFHRVVSGDGGEETAPS